MKIRRPELQLHAAIPAFVLRGYIWFSGFQWVFVPCCVRSGVFVGRFSFFRLFFVVFFGLFAGSVVLRVRVLWFGVPGFCCVRACFPCGCGVVLGFRWCFACVFPCLRHAGGVVCFQWFPGWSGWSGLRVRALWCKFFSCCRSANGSGWSGSVRWVSGGGLRTQERICTTSL